jgi:MFS transporter, DHA1 family, inner membrane transport protein
MSSATSSLHSTRTDWPLVGLLFGTGLLAAGQFAKISLTLGPLEAVYPGAVSNLPFVVSALSVMGILFGATAGMLVARLGVRTVLLAGLAAGALLSAVQALLPPFPLLVVLRLVEGAAHLAIVVSAPTLMAAVSSSHDRPVVMGLWGTFFGVGFAIAAAVAPGLLAAFGIPGVYLAHAGALLVLALLLASRLPPAGVPQPDGRGFVERHLAIYRDPRAVAPGIGFFWHSLMFLGLITYLPRFLGEWAGPVLPLVALVGTMAAGAMARVIPPRHVLIVGFVLTVAGVALLLAVPDGLRGVVAVPLFVVIGLAPGAAFAMVPELNHDPADQARANGALAQLGNLGTASSTPLFALTLGAGLVGAGVLAGAIAAIGVVAVWLIHRKIATSA